MASSENQQQTPSPAPPSLSAGDHEMRDYYAAQDASRPPSQQEPYLTPYLGLQARLSQVWINRWTILLLLVLIRTLFAIASLDDNLGTARKQALSACNSVENVGSAMASMPYYMSQGVNELSADGIEKAINGLMQMLIMSITGVEEIVVFIINLLTSTYVCLITLAVSGSLQVAVTVAEDVGSFLNSTIQDVGKDLGNATADFQTAMNGFMADIDKIGSALTGKTLTPPTIDLTSEISKLDSFQLPTDYDSDLQKLNASIPTFAQVHNFTNAAIELPFEEVKKLLNESLPKYTMNRSLFPVPAKQELTFCSDNNGVNAFFDDLVEIEHLAKKIFLVVVCILAVLAMIPMAYREYRRYKFMEKRAQTIVRNDSLEPMDSVYIVSRPYTADAGLWLAKHFSSGRRKALVRWSVAYATTVPALFVLSLALAGLLGCLCQYILLKSIEKEVPAIESIVEGFADKVIYALNNASEQWAVGTNNIINDTNVKINDDVFGWVNTTTSAVNNTLNVFVDGMVDVLNVTFGGTVLYEPILDVLNCLVLLKIQGIENGLTWVSDNAQIDFPLLPNDTFSLGTLSKVSGSQADVLSTGANGEAADAISDAVLTVTNAVQKTIRQEAIISTCVLLIWVLIALIGIARASFLMFKGGDGGVYTGPPPTKRTPSPGEQHELDDFFPTTLPAPTYEQATSSKADPGSNNGNMYNGQTYTLRPNPLPAFEINTATSPIFHTGFSPPNEKMGSVNGQNVDSAIRRPTHIRASSHGDYAVTSPTSPPPANPFLSTRPIDEKTNPFADPMR